MPSVIERPASGLILPDEAVLTAVKQLTNAQILALNGTPQELVPAQGAGFAVVVESVFLYFDSSGAYTIGTGNMKVEYASGADIIDITDAGFMDQASDQARVFTPAAGGLTPVGNSAVRLINEVANYTGGNAANTLSVKVFYRIMQMQAFS